MKAVLLGRVSRGERQQDPENQLGPLRATIPRLGGTVVGELSLKLSAWDETEAAEVWRLVLMKIRETGADTLAVWAVDRFCRGGPHQMLNRIHELEKHHGVRLYSLQEPFLSTATADPHLRDALIAFFAWMAAAESERKSQRLRAKVASRRREASKLGQRARWGRGQIPTDEDRRRIHALQAAGLTRRQIAAEVGLSLSTVHRVCFNPPPSAGADSTLIDPTRSSASGETSPAESNTIPESNPLLEGEDP